MAIDGVDPRPEIERPSQRQLGIERRRLVAQRAAFAARHRARSGAQQSGREPDQARLARAIGAAQPPQIGSASRRERVCQSEYITVLVVSLTKNLLTHSQRYTY